MIETIVRGARVIRPLPTGFDYLASLISQVKCVLCSQGSFTMGTTFNFHSCVASATLSLKMLEDQTVGEGEYHGQDEDVCVPNTLVYLVI